jgi:hypothetical protein
VEKGNGDYSFALEMEVQQQESTDDIAAVAAVGDIRVAYLLILLAGYHSAPPVDLA